MGIPWKTTASVNQSIIIYTLPETNKECMDGYDFTKDASFKGITILVLTARAASANEIMMSFNN